MKFKVKNVNCMNCVNLIKNSLEDEFGNIEVDLDQKNFKFKFRRKSSIKFYKRISRFRF